MQPRSWVQDEVARVLSLILAVLQGWEEGTFALQEA